MKANIKYTPIKLTFNGHVVLYDFERVRIEKGFTYQAIGQRYGLDRSLIRTVVIGQNNLYCERAIQMAFAVGVKPDDLFLRDIILLGGDQLVFINNPSENTTQFLEKIKNLSYKDRLKFCIELFNMWSDGKITHKKGEVPFTPDIIGFPKDIGTQFSSFLDTILKSEEIRVGNKIMVDDICSVKSRGSYNQMLKNYIKLPFKDKKDILNEIILRFDTRTLFQEKKDFPKFPGFFTGWDIADTMRSYELEEE